MLRLVISWSWMDAAEQAGRLDQLEGFVERVVADAGKARRVGLEGRELEGAGAGLDQAGNGMEPVLDGDRGVERDVDMGVALDHRDLLVEELGAGDRLRLVIGHIDHDGDAAGRRRARAHADAFVIGLAARVDLAVDDAGHDPLAAEILGLARRRRRA
ncbi:hypothetical protein [Bosea thiooxidans]